MNEHWTGPEYERRRRRFLEASMLHRNVYVHVSLILAGTAATGWICSWALLTLGMHSLPLRYLLGFGASYAVFLLLVRMWAGFMRNQRGEDVGWSDGADVASDMVFWGGSEGCFAAVGVGLIGILLAGLVALIGGLPLLLEVAFEVAFAGAIVRGARGRHVVGDWLGAALRNTWMPAAIAAVLLVGLAGYLQHQAPQAHTLRQAINTIWP